MGNAREDLIRLIRRERCDKRSAPVKLGPGGETDVYLDIKGLVTNYVRMRMVADAMWEHLYNLGLDAWEPNGPTFIGGPTMGADVISHALVCTNMAMGPWRWFSVRDHPKITHGLGKWIEGAELGKGDRVVLTDDVVNSGESLMEAHEIVERTGAEVVAVVPLVDRGDSAAERFGVTPYHPLITHADLGIEPLVPV
jgi:orotate phosphoribosyltransferase